MRLGTPTRKSLHCLAGALGMDEDERLEESFDLLSRGWRERPLAAPPRWTPLTLDRTPLEFSANFDRAGHDLRFAVDPQGAEATASSYWESTLALVEALRQRFHACTELFDRLSDVFKPTVPEPYIVSFLATGGSRRGAPAFKLYLSPAARGPGSESGQLHEMFARLGLLEAWDELRRVTGEGARWSLVCLDLEPSDPPTFKLYETLTSHDPAPLAARFAHGSPARPESLERFVTSMRVGQDAVQWSAVAYAFAGGQCTRTAYHVPFSPLGDEEAARARVLDAFDALGVPSAAYRRLLEVSAPGARGTEGLCHNYVSYQEAGGEPRLTTYLSPRLYQGRFGVRDRACWFDNAGE